MCIGSHDAIDGNREEMGAAAMNLYWGTGISNRQTSTWNQVDVFFVRLGVCLGT